VLQEDAPDPVSSSRVIRRGHRCQVRAPKPDLNIQYVLLSFKYLLAQQESIIDTTRPSTRILTIIRCAVYRERAS